MTEKQVLKHTVSYEEELIKALKDPEEARAYLEVALDECEASGETDGLLLALRDVAQAQGGVGALAERAGLNREHLYRVLSSRSKPKLDNLIAIISPWSFGSYWISLVDRVMTLFPSQHSNCQSFCTVPQAPPCLPQIP